MSKARLIVQGWGRHHGIDCGGTYAPNHDKITCFGTKLYVMIILNKYDDMNDLKPVFVVFVISWWYGMDRIVRRNLPNIRRRSLRRDGCYLIFEINETKNGGELRTLPLQGQLP